MKVRTKVSTTNMRIRMSEFLRFLESNPDSRNVIEGQNLQEAGHVIMYGLLKDLGEQKKVFGLCLQTSALSSHPHQINITLKIMNTDVVINDAKCSCKGGANGKCKHVSAVLWICMSNDIEKFSLLTSTDLACWWKQKQKNLVDNYRLNKVSDQECFTKGKVVHTVVLPDSTVQDIEKDFASIQTSAFSIFRNEEVSLPCTSQAESTVTPAISDEILDALANAVLGSDITLLEEPELPTCCKGTYGLLFEGTNWYSLPSDTRNRHEWMQARKWRITASRSYELYTYTVNRNPDWLSKTKRYFFPASFTNKFIEHGLENEDPAIEAYEVLVKKKVVRTGLITHPGHLWLGCTPDGILFNESNSIDKIIEVKCPYAGKTKPISDILTDLPYVEGGKLKKKHPYYAQIQVYLGLLNSSVCDLVLYSSFDRSLLTIEVERDQNFFQDLIQSLHCTYFKNMLHFVCINKDWLNN